MVLTWGSSLPARSQTEPPNAEVAEEPIVIDGREVFKVRDIPNFTAANRASSINKLLREEVQYTEPAVIEIATDSNDWVYLKSRSSENHLLTVTEADLPNPGYPIKRRARDWANVLQKDLRQGQWERRPAYVRQAILYSLAVLVSAIALHLLLRILSRRSSRQLDRWFTSTARPLTTWERPTKFFWQLGLFGLKIGLWLTVFIYITDLFPQLRSWRYTLVYYLTAPRIVLGTQQYSALRLLLLIGLTVGLWFAAQLIAKLFKTYVLNKASIDPQVQNILSFLAQYVLLFLGSIVLLQAFGINASSLAILASLLGVGIGFGVQNITNNFISGFIITLERPIQVGDFIKLGDLVGIVKQVGARSTEINTLDKVTIIVPNSRFLESEVINWSHGDSISRLRVPVGVAYGADIDQVKKALLEAVKRHPEVLLRPEPDVWFQSFGDSALNFEIMVWTGEPRKQFRVRSDLNYAIEASLRRYGIEIPFPQQDLHLRSPQLDEILHILKQRAINVPDTDGNNAHKPSLTAVTPPPAVEPSVTPPSKQESSLADNLLTNLDLETLAEAMQGPQGIELKSHPKQPEAPPTYFTGTAVVEWLKQNRDYTHEGAILVGQWLLHKGLIHTTDHDHTVDPDFEDSQILYQFYQDSPAALGKSIESPANPVTSDGDVTKITPSETAPETSHHLESAAD